MFSKDGGFKDQGNELQEYFNKIRELQLRNINVSF